MTHIEMGSKSIKMMSHITEPMKDQVMEMFLRDWKGFRSSSNLPDGSYVLWASWSSVKSEHSKLSRKNHTLRCRIKFAANDNVSLSGLFWIIPCKSFIDYYDDTRFLSCDIDMYQLFDDFDNILTMKQL